MPKIRVLSRAEMLEEYILDRKIFERCKIISIYGFEASPVFPEHPNVLTLNFDDVISQWDSDTILFDESMAEQVIAFLNTVEQGDELIVHCFAGISRSGAIGLFAARFLGLDLEDFFSQHPHISPNPLVLRVLDERRQELGIPPRYWTPPQAV
jgi:predicted protein tyrosine phosphatase